MSIDQKELKIRLKTRRNRTLVGVLLATEFILSVILCVSLAAQIVWPGISSAQGQIGTPLLLNYEGYLTDSSNNPLGGTGGTEYCFHFSIYNQATGGNKLWPGIATPSVTTATATDGVFNAVIGSSDAFASTTFDFSTTSTAYLDVAVNTTSGATCTSGGSYQELTPRQQILSSGYALTSNNVTGQALTTVEAPTGSTTVQVGLGGGGGASPVYLGLDIKNIATPGQDYVGNTCTVNGLVWYDSATSHVLVCIGGFVEALDNNGATTTIAAMTDAAGVTVSSGTINFANAGGVSFGFNGNILTAAAPAGGGGVTLSGFEPYPLALAASNSMSYLPSIGSWYVQPFVAPQAIGSGRINILESFSNSSAMLGASNGTSFGSATTGTRSISYIMNQSAALYSRGAGANSTRIDSFWSSLWSIGIAETISVTTSGATSIGASYSVTATYIASVGSNGGTTTSSYGTNGGVSTAQSSMSTLNLSNGMSSLLNMLSGEVVVPIPFNTSIPAGEYWLAQAWSTASTTGGTSVANILPLVNKVALFNNASAVMESFRHFGNTVSNSSSQIFPGAGIFSVGSATPPASMQFIDIRSVASYLTQYFNIINITA